MSKLLTVQSYSIIMFFSTIIVLVTGFSLWIMYDGNEQISFGLRQSDAELLIASMLPIILINLIGFRETVFSTMVSVGEVDNHKNDIPINSGGIFLYTVGLMGIVAALFCILFVSAGLEVTKAKMVITITAAIWGGTTGVVFNKYFKQYT